MGGNCTSSKLINTMKKNIEMFSDENVVAQNGRIKLKIALPGGAEAGKTIVLKLDGK
jgi:hypothetical protein